MFGSAIKSYKSQYGSVFLAVKISTFTQIHLDHSIFIQKHSIHSLSLVCYIKVFFNFNLLLIDPFLQFLFLFKWQVWGCTLCTKTGAGNPSLEFHLELYHALANHTCVCGKTHSTLNDLIQHINHVHTTRSYVCCRCFLSFNHGFMAEEHMRESHPRAVDLIKNL